MNDIDNKISFLIERKKMFYLKNDYVENILFLFSATLAHQSAHFYDKKEIT